MLRSNFGYNGPSAAAKEFVDTVNKMAELLNGMQVDLGDNGGTDLTLIRQEGGMKIDMTQLYIPSTADIETIIDDYLG